MENFKMYSGQILPLIEMVAIEFKLITQRYDDNIFEIRQQNKVKIISELHTRTAEAEGTVFDASTKYPTVDSANADFDARISRIHCCLQSILITLESDLLLSG